MEAATAVDPGNIEFHFNLGLLYREANQAEKAIEEWKRVLEIDPTHEDAKILIEKYSNE